MSELDRIAWTGDPDVTVQLDVQDPLGQWAAKAWSALLALQDYAKCRADGTFGMPVDAYLQETPQGLAKYPANRHARDESEDVKSNPKFSGPRTFAVPKSVDGEGRIFMGAHFKIAQSGMISPRLHYLDTVAFDGKVYIGYLGPHLPTKKTN